MKSFKQYLSESARERNFVIKMVIEPTDMQISSMESMLKKYDLIDLTNPTMIEGDKIDFSEIPNRSIWQMRVTLGMPITSYILLQNLRNLLNISEDYIVVRTMNEPIQVYAEEEQDHGPAYDWDKPEDGLVPASRLSTDRFYDDAEQPLLTDLFGDEYNKKLLDYLRKIEDDRPTDHYDAPAPLFSWIEMNKIMDADAVDDTDFNERFDTPKPVNKDKGKDVDPIEPRYLGPSGNLDDAASPTVKLMKDEKGNRKSVSAPRAKLKAEKVR
jgi:hypothetical protein